MIKLSMTDCFYGIFFILHHRNRVARKVSRRLLSISSPNMDRSASVAYRPRGKYLDTVVVQKPQNACASIKQFINHTWAFHIGM